MILFSRVMMKTSLVNTFLVVKLGIHGGHGSVLGRRRGSRVCRCGVGSRRVVDRDDTSPLGVSEGGVVEENRGRGFWQSDGLGLLLPLMSN
jgi:hypothetical protein